MRKKRSLLLLVSILLVFNLSIVTGQTCCFAEGDNFCESDILEGVCCPDGSCESWEYDSTHPCDQTEYCAFLGCCVKDCSWKERSLCPNSAFFDANEIYAYYNEKSSCEGVYDCELGCCCLKTSGGVSNDRHENAFRHQCGPELPSSPNFYFYPGDPNCELCTLNVESVYLGHVTGTATSSTGALPNVRVEIGGKTDFPPSSGVYNIRDIPQGEWTIVGYHQDYKPVVNTAVDIIDAQTTTVDLFFSDPAETGVVQGYVYNSTGHPLEGAGVYFLDKPAYYTDASGFYRIGAAPVGVTQFIATKKGYTSSQKSANVGGLDEIDFTLDKKSITDTCGDNVVDPLEECDGLATGTPCDGFCIPATASEDIRCKCPVFCSDLGGACVAFDYQCTGAGGSLTSDPYECTNSCCDRSDIEEIRECAESIGDTIISGLSGTMCKCEDDYYDVQTDNGWCCAGDDGKEYKPASEPCSPTGVVQGLIYWDNSGVREPVKGAKITLSKDGTKLVDFASSSDGVSAGTYAITDAVEGTYTVTVTMQYYEDWVLNDYVVVADTVQTLDIELTPKNTICITDPPAPVVTVGHEKGVAALILNWNATECLGSATSMWIYRKIEGGAFEFIDQEAISGSTPIEYTDTSVEWNETYSYKIIMNVQSGESSEVEVNDVSPGLDYCEGVMTNPEDFDGSQGYVDTMCLEFYQFDDYQKSGEERTNRIACNEQNIGVLWDVDADGNGDPGSQYGSCEMKYSIDSECYEYLQGTPAQWYTACTNPTDECRDIEDGEADNVYGMFHSKDDCQTSPPVAPETVPSQKYCYWETSLTTVNDCQSCFSTGKAKNCFDYLSKDSCTTDNCFYASRGGECKWYEDPDNFQDLGKGYCFLPDVQTTEKCDLCGKTDKIRGAEGYGFADSSTQGDALKLYYNIECTDDVCSSLGQCYSKDDEYCAKCAPTVACEDYTSQTGCVGPVGARIPYSLPDTIKDGATTCRSQDEETLSNDACGIGKCKHSGTVCYKDADDDGTKDCDGERTGNLCMADFVPPMTAVGELPDYLNAQGYEFDFTVTDIAGSEIKEAKYCFDLDGTCCPIHDLNYDETDETYNFSVPSTTYGLVEIEDTAYIRYYSEDIHRNIELINTLKIYVDTIFPVITFEPIAYKVIDHVGSESTSDLTLNFSVSEYSLCSDWLHPDNNVFVLEKHPVFHPDVADLPGGVSIETSSMSSEAYQEGIPDGTYIYELNCTDAYENTVQEKITIEIDRVRNISVARPSDLTTVNSSIKLYVETLAQRFQCAYAPIINGVEGSYTTFNTGQQGYGIEKDDGDYYYFKDLQGFPTGTYFYRVTCWDLGEMPAGSIADTATIYFTVDQQAPTSVLWRQTPAGDVLYNPDEVYKSPKLFIVAEDQSLGPPDEFGLDKTYYCLDDTGVCDPETEFQVGDFITMDSGNHNLCWYSVDLGENSEEVQCTTIVNDDITPKVSFLPHENVTNLETMRLYGKFSDNSAVSIYVSVTDPYGRKRFYDGIIIDSTFYVDVELYPEINFIQVKAEDIAENFAYNDTIIYRDSIGPDFLTVAAYDHDEKVIISENVETGGVNKGGHAEFGHLIYFLVRASDPKWSENVSRIEGSITCADPDGCGYSHTFTMTRVGEQDQDYGFFSKDENSSFVYVYDPWSYPFPSVGSYNVTYTAYDEFLNTNTYMQKFDVNDTVGPKYNITIQTTTFSREGWPKVTQGITYTVLLRANEPLENVTLFKYKVDPPSEYTEKELTPISGSGTDWTFTMRIYDNAYFEDLYGNNSEFLIIAYDINGIPSDETYIDMGRYFEVDTFGGNEPILVPKLKNPLYTKNSTLYLTGHVDPEEGDVFLRYDFNNSQATVSNDFPIPWSDLRGSAIAVAPDHGNFAVGENVIYLTYDNTDNFTVGRYIEFPPKRTHLERYLVTGVSYSASADTTMVTFTPALEDAILDGSTVESYDEEVPTGWFGMNLNIVYGNNSVYMREVDDMGNIGVPLEQLIFFDDQPPQFSDAWPEPETFSARNFTNISLVITDELSELDLNSISVEIISIGNSKEVYHCGSVLVCVVRPNTTRTLDISMELGLLDFGDYRVKVNASDVMENHNTFTWDFHIGPVFNITIHTNTYSPDGWPKVTRGRDYTVDVLSNTPLSNVGEFKYSVFNPYSNYTEKDLTYSSGTGLLWSYILRVYDNDYFDDLYGNNTEFIIRATDLNDVTSNQDGIRSGRYFEIDTFGGNAPDLVPWLPNPYFTTNRSLYISGYLNPREGDMFLRYLYDGPGGPRTEDLPVYWSEELDSGTVYGANRASYTAGVSSVNISLDKTSTFTPGRYVEFDLKRTHQKRYRIVSSTYRPVGDLTIITIEPALEKIVRNSETARVYAEEVPVGWFGFPLTLGYGHASVLMRGLDEMGNLGEPYLQNITLDDIAPEFYDEEPYANTFSATNKSNISIVIYDDLSAIDLDSLKMVFGILRIEEDLGVITKEYSEYGSFSCGSDMLCTEIDDDPNRILMKHIPVLLDPISSRSRDVYHVNVSGSDIIGNQVEFVWNFSVSEYFPRLGVSPSREYKGKFYTNNARPTINVTIDDVMESVFLEASFQKDGINTRCSKIRESGMQVVYECDMLSSFTDEKEYRLYIYTKSAVNDTLQSWAYGIIYDRTPPVVNVTEHDKTNQKNITVTGTYEDEHISNLDPVTVTGDTDYNPGTSYCPDFPSMLGVPCANVVYGSFDVEVSLDTAIDGTKHLTINAYDLAMNRGTGTLDVIFDSTPPWVTLDSIESTPLYVLSGKKVTNNTKVLVKGTYQSDDTETIYLEVFGPSGKTIYDNLTINGNNWEAEIFLSAGSAGLGEFNVTIVAEDILGNKGVDYDLVYVDQAGPILKSFKPANSMANPPTIELTTDEWATCTVAFVDYNGRHLNSAMGFNSNQTIHTTTLSSRLPEIPDGEYPSILNFNCTDIFGQMSSGSEEITIDHMMPTIINLSLTNPDGHLRDINYPIFDYVLYFDLMSGLEVFASEPVICKFSRSSYIYSGMGDEFIGYQEQTFADIASTTDITFQDKTSYKYYVGCEDIAGNVADVATIDIEVDLFGPIDIHDIKPTPYSDTKKPTVSLRTYRDATCTLDVLGGEAAIWTFLTKEFQDEETELKLSINPNYYGHYADISGEPGLVWKGLQENAEYTFRVSCEHRTDSRISPSQEEFKFLVDSLPPNIQITSPPNGHLSNNSIVHVEGTAEMGATVKVYVDDIEQTPAPIVADDGTFDITVTVKDGANVITAEATDAADNKANDSITVEYISIGPFVRSIDPIDGSMLKTIDSIEARLGSIDGELDFTKSNITVYRNDTLITGSMQQDGNETMVFRTNFVDGNYRAVAIPFDTYFSESRQGPAWTTTFILDGDLPLIVVISPEEVVDTDVVEFKGYIIAESGLEDKYLELDGTRHELSMTGSAFTATVNIVGGQNNYTIFATNLFGDEAQKKGIVILPVDRTPPWLTLDSVDGNPLLDINGRKTTNNATMSLNGRFNRSDTARLTVNVSGPQGIVSYDLTSTTTDDTYSLDNFILQPGFSKYANFTIRVIATDAAGNKAVVSEEVYLDYKGPEVIKIIPEKTTINPPSIEVWTDEWAEDCSVEFNDDRDLHRVIQMTSNSNKTVHKADLQFRLHEVAGGEYPTNLRFNCTDVFGVSSSSTSEIRIDFMKPTIINVTMTNYNAHLLNVSYPYVEYVLYFNLSSGFEVYASEDVLCKYSNNYTDYHSMEKKFQGYDEREYSQTVVSDDLRFDDFTGYTYYIACEDISGNIANYTILDITVDKDGPIYIHRISPQGFTSDLTPDIYARTFREADCTLEVIDENTGFLARVWDWVKGIFVDDVVEMNIQKRRGYYLHSSKVGGDIDIDLEENAQYEFNISCVDPTGQVDPDNEVFNFLVDSQPPTVVITYPPNLHESEHSLINVTGTTEVGALITMYVDSIEQTTGPLPSDGTFNLMTVLKNGANKITVEAQDRAGNRMTDKVDVFYETQGPSVKSILPEHGSFLKNITRVSAELFSYDGLLALDRSTIKLMKDEVEIPGLMTDDGNNSIIFTSDQELVDGIYKIVVVPYDYYFSVLREGEGAFATFVIDSDLPEIIVTYPNSTYINSRKIVIKGFIIAESGLKSTWLDMDGTIYTIVMDGSLFNSTVNTIEGENNYTIHATNLFDGEAIKKGVLIRDSRGPEKPTVYVR